jgi:hypothetical protein
MSKAADELRQLAKEAGKRGDKTKSLKEGAREHKREKALNDLAENDWLDGKPKRQSLRSSYFPTPVARTRGHSALNPAIASSRDQKTHIVSDQRDEGMLDVSLPIPMTERVALPLV